MASKKRTINTTCAWVCLVIGAISLAVTSILIVNSDIAYAANYSSYNDCVNKSGIPDLKSHVTGGSSGVDWACRKSMDNDWTRYCVMWVGNKNDFDIEINAGSGTASTNLYGMCTNTYLPDRPGMNAKWIRIDGDNGSISEPSGEISRGLWGSPTGTSVSINVNKFISGVTPTVSGNKRKYTRDISVYRCNTNESSNSCDIRSKSSSSVPSGCNCDWEYPTLTLTIPIPKVTLTAYAGVLGTYNSQTDTRTYLKSDGTTSNSASGAWTNSSTVDSGSNATVTTANFNPVGYTWHAWGGSCSDATTRPCTKSNLTSNTNVYAYYTRNAFKGRARIKSGTAVDDTNSTGYVTSASTKSIEINCANAGCKAAWDLALSRTAGSGTTGYYIGTSSNGGTTSWAPLTSASALAFPRTGVTGTVSSGTGAGSDSLLPGNSKCHYVRFRPYGASSNDTYINVGACVTAKVTTFQGKSSVTGTNAGTSTTDWQNTNTSKVGQITNCSPTSGCKVTFTHHVKITSAGGGSSDWTVTRTSNLIAGTKGITVDRGSSASSGTYSDTNASGRQVSTSGELTLYPGMVVCERLTFKPDNKSGTSDVYTQQCASALGDAQPEDPDDPDNPEDPPSDPEDPNDPNYLSGDTSFINIKVRNQDVSTYNKFQLTVYAKPGDVVTYRASYNPVLQYTYDLKPQKMKINNGTIYPTSGVNTSRTLAAMFNLYKTSSMSNWNNGFNVYSSNFALASYNQAHTYTRGSTDKRAEYNSHTVATSEVGRSLDETAKTNNTSTTKTTPGQVSFVNSSDTNIGNVSTVARQKTASALVPYNFRNSTEVTRDTTEPMYAGETASVNFNIVTSPKRNNVTDGTYATIVRDAKWKLELSYYSPQDGRNVTVETTEKTGNLNRNYKLDGDTDSKVININIPDVPAGTDLCIRSAVYPANSGANTNWNNTAGNDAWAYSGQKCFKVAKRPSIEVWGGNTYSRRAISLNETVKNNLAYYTGYQVEGTTSRSYVFGSWTELGLVASGTVKGLSSGASLGHNSINNGDLWPGYHPANGLGNNSSIAGRAPGGSDKKSLCDRSPLTFSNTCRSGLVGSLGSAAAASNADDDKSAIVSKFIFGGEANVANPNNVTLNNAANKREGTNTYYYNGGSNKLTLPGGTISKGTVQVVHTKGNNIIINGNLEYEDRYTSLSDIPKLIIYAEKGSNGTGEIRIGCGVTRIDAVLIADSVLTCNNLEGDTITENHIKAKINDQANSNQLKVNGAIITGKLYPNRTYGAATGANSMVPAEIINFDPSLYTWGVTSEATATSGDADSNGTLDVTYKKELAPRL